MHDEKYLCCKLRRELYFSSGTLEMEMRPRYKRGRDLFSGGTPETGIVRDV